MDLPGKANDHKAIKAQTPVGVKQIRLTTAIATA